MNAAANGRATQTPNETPTVSAHAGPSPRRGRRAGGGGRGLPGLRARLDGCGGSFEIRSAIGQGTTVVMRVPLNPTASDVVD